MTRQILTEFIAPGSKPLNSIVDNEGKKLWLKGTAIQGEVFNHNGRFYPRNEIFNAVTTLQKQINETGPVAGELDHPEGLTINGQNVSHGIHQIRMEGNDGYTEMLVINAGQGQVVRGIIESGIHVGVSSRGQGSLDSKGKVSDFEIATIDIVMTPSAPDARPRPVFESLSSYHGQELLHLTEALRHDKIAQKYIKKTFHDFLMSIRDDVIWNTK